MFSKVFLARTDRETSQFPPGKTAYMACHFSPYGTGLSNLPKGLPKGSLLLLDDSMPVQNHDSAVVCQQLSEIVSTFAPHAVLLDFQREQSNAALAMIETILHSLPCPVAVTEQYADRFSCPVLLSPPPVNRALRTHIAPWTDRGIFLEIGTDAAQITVDPHGSSTTPLLPDRMRDLPLTDTRLHCHYRVEIAPGKAIFTLQREAEDLAALANDAYAMGVLGVLGLYQELCR